MFIIKLLLVTESRKDTEESCIYENNYNEIGKLRMCVTYTVL